MKKSVLLVCIAVLALHASATEKLPPDGRTFIADREGCDHLRGEVPKPLDKQRMKELKGEIQTLCTGMDRKLTQLKRKYATNRTVMKRLGEIEPEIEAGRDD
jgi:hypothetical protein